MPIEYRLIADTDEICKVRNRKPVGIIEGAASHTIKEYIGKVMHTDGLIGGIL